MRPRKPRKPLQNQQAFDFSRAAKLNTLERVSLSASTKSLLKALDAFIRDQEWYCVTVARISLSMGYQRRATQLAIREAQRLGLVEVQASESDGASNRYRIDWQAVFSLPDGSPPRRGRRPGPVAATSHAERLPAPASEQSEGGAKTPTGGRIKCAGGAHILRGGGALNAPVSRTDHINDQVTTTSSVSSSETAANQDGGGGAVQENPRSDSRASRGRTPSRSSGSWVGFLDKGLLSTQEGIRLVFDSALRAGLITNTPRYQIRVLALCRQAVATADSPAGYVVKRIEKGDWQFLGEKYVTAAAQRLGIRLDPEQKQTVRTPESLEVCHGG